MTEPLAPDGASPEAAIAPAAVPTQTEGPVSEAAAELAERQADSNRRVNLVIAGNPRSETFPQVKDEIARFVGNFPAWSFQGGEGETIGTLQLPASEVAFATTHFKLHPGVQVAQ